MHHHLQAALRAYGTPIALLLICLAFAWLSPDAFATSGNLLNVLKQISVLVIVGMGATLVMATGEFDLSVGAVASLGGVAAALLAVAGFGLPAQLLIVLGSAFVLGVLNGLVVTRLGVLSFIATLAGGTLVGGMTFWLSGGATVFEGVPDAFTWLGRSQFGGLTGPTWIMLTLALLGALLMRYSVFGRQLLAIGGNPVAAQLAGVTVTRHKVLAFALCSTLASLAGLLLASRIGSAQPSGGDALFLPSYAAVFLGITASRQAVPNILGTVIGAALLGVLANGLTILNCPTYVQQMLTGAIVIGAVAMQRLGRQ